jgi:hypothetical protein
LLNSPEIQKKLSHETGTISKLVMSHSNDAKLIEELYLRLYARFPTAKEHDTAVNYLANKPSERGKATEDIVWALLNSLEFQFNH